MIIHLNTKLKWWRVEAKGGTPTEYLATKVKVRINKKIESKVLFYFHDNLMLFVKNGNWDLNKYFVYTMTTFELHLPSPLKEWCEKEIKIKYIQPKGNHLTDYGDKWFILKESLSTL